MIASDKNSDKMSKFDTSSLTLEPLEFASRISRWLMCCLWFCYRFSVTQNRVEFFTRKSWNSNRVMRCPRKLSFQARSKGVHFARCQFFWFEAPSARRLTEIVWTDQRAELRICEDSSRIKLKCNYIGLSQSDFGSEWLSRRAASVKG